MNRQGVMLARRLLFFLLGVVAATALVLVLSDCDATLWLLDSIDRRTNLFDYSHERRLLRPGGDGDRDLFATKDRGDFIGTVTIDFYRTFEYIGFGKIQFRLHSITKLRIWKELKGINKWYDGRLVFEMGDIISYDNPSMHETEDGCDRAIVEFATSDDVRNLNHISAVYIKRQGGLVTSECSSGYFVPLGSGGNGTVAPAVLVGMSYDIHPPIPWLGIPTIGSGTFSHRVAHLIGMEHTNIGTGIHTFSECGLNLRYPYFSDFVDEVVDPVTNITYYERDWLATTNILGPIDFPQIIGSPLEVGLFKANYIEVFETITQCWYNSSVTDGKK